MGMPPQLITDELYKKATLCLKSLSQINRAAIRLRAIVSAKEQGVNVVAQVFGITTNTLRAWVKAFSKEDLAGLDYQPGRGRKSNLSSQHFQAIRDWTQKDPNVTLKVIVENLQQHYGVKTSKSGVQRILHKLDLSYITPRPVHHKQDKNTHLEFKKKSS
jgi:transposase